MRQGERRWDESTFFLINKGWEADEMKQASATVKVQSLSDKSGNTQDDTTQSRVSSLQRPRWDGCLRLAEPEAYACWMERLADISCVL